MQDPLKPVYGCNDSYDSREDGASFQGVIQWVGKRAWRLLGQAPIKMFLGLRDHQKTRHVEKRFNVRVRLLMSQQPYDLLII